MPRPEFSFDVDVAQWRQSKDRIGFSAAGDDFNTGQYFADTFIDPLTSTLMLRPRPFYAAWYTSNTAPYDKLGLADFGLGATWSVTDITGVGGSKYLEGPTSAKGTSVITTATYAKNTGFYVGFFGYSEGSRYTLAEFGWDAGGSVTSNTACRLYSDGVVEVWRGGIKVVEGQVSGAKGSATIQNTLIEMVLIPCRHRELLVLSTAGNGVRAVFDDILDSDTDPTITPATKFWVKMYGTVKFQAAPLKFATSGYAASMLYDLAEAPATGAVLETNTNPSWASGSGRVYGNQSYRTGNTDAVVASLTDTDGTTAFVPDGVKIQVRVKAALTGNGFSSPFVYGISGGYKALSANTDASESANLSTYWQNMSFSVPETGGATLRWDLFDPLGIGITGLQDHANKPTKTTLGTTVFHNGITEPIEWIEGTTPSLGRATLTANSHITQLLKTYMFRERMVFDGMLISHASSDCVIKRLVELVGGSSADLALETATVRAGDIAPALCGDFSEIADIGENAWSYLSRVMQDYLGGWWYGEYPHATTPKFTTKSPATINAAASKFTFYDTIANAIAGGKAAAEAWRYVYRQQRYHYINPEANEIIVTGFDPRQQQPVQAVKRDTSSIDPTLAPSARPTNWIGGLSRLGLINKGLATQALADSAAALLYDRCSPARQVNEIEVELPVVSDVTGFPVWVSDKVTLNGVDFIVTSIQGGVEKDPNSAASDDFMWRPCTYVLSNIVGYSNSASFDEIVAFGTMNGVRTALARRGFIEGSITRMPIYTRNVL
jgi:hypothetical protein